MVFAVEPLSAARVASEAPRATVGEAAPLP